MQCDSLSYNLTLQRTLTPADLLLAGLSQAYLQTFQPAALAITYGHLLNAKVEACRSPNNANANAASASATPSNFDCAPGNECSLILTHFVSTFCISYKEVYIQNGSQNLFFATLTPIL